jgi:hypothetical protein
MCDCKIARYILVDSVLKKRQDGKNERIREFENEGQRVESIKDVFGIPLTESGAIKGSKLSIENLPPTPSILVAW